MSYTVSHVGKKGWHKNVLKYKKACTSPKNVTVSAWAKMFKKNVGTLRLQTKLYLTC